MDEADGAELWWMDVVVDAEWMRVEKDGRRGE